MTEYHEHLRRIELHIPLETKEDYTTTENLCLFLAQHRMGFTYEFWHSIVHPHSAEIKLGSFTFDTGIPNVIKELLNVPGLKNSWIKVYFVPKENPHQGPVVSEDKTHTK